jgi:hypothetical protein
MTPLKIVESTFLITMAVLKGFRVEMPGLYTVLYTTVTRA